MKPRLIALLVGVALAAGGVGLWATRDRTGPVATAQESTPGIPVTLGVVAAQDVPVLLQGIGTVQAFNTIAIKSRVDGTIVAVDFTEGEEVEANAVLLEIDPRPYQAALNQARAAKAKDIAQLESAQLDFERSGKLLSRGFQTQQIFDQQKATVGQLRAAIEGDQAQIETAELNLEYTKVRAPIAGRLGARLVDIGNLVRAGDATPLVMMTQVRPVFVTFTLPQQNFEDVRDRQIKAPLTVKAYTSDDARELSTGRLTLIDNAIDQLTGTIRLKAQFDNEDERLWPGEFVNVRVVLDTRRAVPTVPAQAVQDGPDGPIVYVVGPGDTVHRKAIEVASVQDGVAAVTQGLAPGERVVVNGQYRLTEGARVNAAPPGPSAKADGGMR
ncbi:MAG TPA: efflux RND transporter periplasmic adaptor subunit [Xanthobacteraceae bacterium]|nr:efflux RND transporter periplasmic adaptor subunit [Xanthobacteraceae bacterium]